MSVYRKLSLGFALAQIFVSMFFISMFLSPSYSIPDMQHVSYLFMYVAISRMTLSIYAISTVVFIIGAIFSLLRDKPSVVSITYPNNDTPAVIVLKDPNSHTYKWFPECSLHTLDDKYKSWLTIGKTSANSEFWTLCPISSIIGMSDEFKRYPSVEEGMNAIQYILKGENVIMSFEERITRIYQEAEEQGEDTSRYFAPEFLRKHDPFTT